MNSNDATFAQLATLGSSLVLLFGIALLWRRSLGAYVQAFRWQSLALALTFALIGYFGHNRELYVVAVILVVLKVVIIPGYLTRLYERVGGKREAQPYADSGLSDQGYV
jgi:hydrogenase-4 membrane subunit HyfE